MTTFYAQPYDISANGFYFECYDDYQKKVKKAVNAYGQAVKEFEIQFIDGEEIDSQLFDALGLNQANIGPAIAAAENWDEWQKLKVSIAVGECGYDFDLEKGGPDDFDIDFYEMDSMREFAQHFVKAQVFRRSLLNDLASVSLEQLSFRAIPVKVSRPDKISVWAKVT